MVYFACEDYLSVVIGGIASRGLVMEVQLLLCCLCRLESMLSEGNGTWMSLLQYVNLITELESIYTFFSELM
jgi:hypothetical protein